MFCICLYSDQSIALSKPSTIQTNVPNSDFRGYRDHGGGDIINHARENPYFSVLSNEVLDRARTYTFSNWPSITPSAQEMSLAGWWYTNIADRVVCIHCDTMFHNWTDTDKPYEIHRLKSPRCYYVRMKEEKGVTSNTNQRQIPVANPTVNEMPNGQTIVGAVHADYAQVFRRTHTFQSWPETQPTLLPSIDSFVEAGFFYTGKDYLKYESKIFSFFH